MTIFAFKTFNKGGIGYYPFTVKSVCLSMEVSHHKYLARLWTEV